MKVISRKQTNSELYVFYRANCPHCKKQVYVDIDKEEIVNIRLAKVLK